MKNKPLIIIFACILTIFYSCKDKETVESVVEREIFYGKIVYQSTVESADSVLIKNMTSISPWKVEVYVNAEHFRMIEFGGLSHGNIILNKQKREAWQLDTIKKLAYYADYSDLGDPGSNIKDLMPDHFKPVVEKTAESEEILGKICIKYKIIRSGFIPVNHEAFIWVAEDIQIPPSRYDMQTEINHCAVPAPLIIGYEEGVIMKLLIKNKSYTRIFEITELDKNNLPAGIFEIPEGYQKK